MPTPSELLASSNGVAIPFEKQELAEPQSEHVEAAESTRTRNWISPEILAIYNDLERPFDKQERAERRSRHVEAAESTGTLNWISDITGNGNIDCDEINERFGGRKVWVDCALLRLLESPAVGDKVTFSWRLDKKGHPEATSVKIPGTSDEVSGSAPLRIPSRIPGTSDQVPGSTPQRTPSRIPGTSDQVPGSGPHRIRRAHDEVFGTRATSSSKHSETVIGKRPQAADRGGYQQQEQQPSLIQDTSSQRSKISNDQIGSSGPPDLETLKWSHQMRRERAEWS